MATVDVDDRCQFSADSQPKSVGLVWGLAATQRSVYIIRWTGWTLAMTLVMMTAPQTLSWLLLLSLQAECTFCFIWTIQSTTNSNITADKLILDLTLGLSQNKLLILQPSVSTATGSRRFSYTAPSIWNKLPLEICNSSSFASFKRNLKTLFSCAFS